MSISDILKKNIPEFQQGSSSLDGYLEAAGEFLDGTKEAIVGLDNVYDYKKATDFFLENSLADRGFRIPSRVKNSEKRRVLRDMSEIHRKNGTLDGILHAIRLAGLTPELRVGWIPSPDYIKRGLIRDPETLEVRRYDVNRYVYTEMLYGDVVVTDNGVFFEGYRYIDSLKENKIGPLPILGERYTVVPENPVSVQKSPYVIVRFDEGEKTLVTDPIIDPVTGEVYEYSTSEEFELINEVLRYFLVENNRPTTLRVIIIVSMLPFVENLQVVEEFSIEDTYHDDGGDIHEESLVVDSSFVGAGTVTVGDLNVGDLHIVGGPSPYATRFSYINLGVGNSADTYPEIYDITTLVATTFVNEDNDLRIPMRGKTDISFSAPLDSNISVYGYYNDVDVPVLLGEVVAGGVYSEYIPFQFRYIKLTPDNPNHAEFTLGVRYWGTVINYIPILTEDGTPLLDETGVQIYI